MREDIQLSFIECQMPRTPYQLERFVVGQHDTPEMQFVQVCRELEALYYTIKEVGMANKRTELEIAKLRATGDEIDAIDADIKELGLERTRLVAITHASNTVATITPIKEIGKIAKDNNVNLILPKDLVVAKSIEDGVDCRTVSIDNIQKDDIALDIGKETMRDLIPIIKKAKTIFWNGTLGYAEINEFAWASKDLAHLMSLRKNKADTIIGGGDTTAFIEKLGMHNRFSFVSTGGGASLELLSGKKLAAIEALRS